MSVQPTPLRAQKVILVEGKDEVNFLEVLLEKEGIKGFEIIDVGGKRNFANMIQLLSLRSGFDNITTFIVIRDADEDSNAAFTSAKRALESVHLQAPDRQNELKETDGRKVGIYIMPGDFQKGMLEDLCMSSVSDHPVMDCIEAFFKCIKEKGYVLKNLSKAKAHVFLATQPELVTSIGLAAKKGYWNFSHPSLQSLNSFLKEA